MPRSRCVAVGSRGGQGVARLEDGRELNADVVVGADGLHSVARAAFLRDSAHATTPNLGQGACLALEDALALALAFDAESAVERALERYEQARFPRGARIAAHSRRLGWIGQLDSPLLCAIRNACMALTPASLMRRAFESGVAFEV